MALVAEDGEVVENFPLLSLTRMFSSSSADSSITFSAFVCCQTEQVNFTDSEK